MKFYVDKENDDEFSNADEEEFEEDEEPDEYEDEIILDDELISEMSEERGGGFVHLRYRDSKGRFAPEIRDSDYEFNLRFNKRVKQVEKEYRKKIHLQYNVKILLLRLVDDFKEQKYFYKDKDGIETDFPYFPLSQFKRIPYPKILESCNMKRSAFSQFVSRMVKQGLIVKIKHGHKLYLRITKKGLDKVFHFWEQYPGESWR